MKWVIGIVVALIVVCGGLCAAGGGYYYWMTQSGGGIEVPTFALDPDMADKLIEPAAGGDGKVGVESCDAYIEKMTACLGTMDAATKSAMESAFKQTTDAWRAAAATPEGKAGLEVGCKAALDAIPSTCSAGASASPADASATAAATTTPTETPATTPAPATTTPPATTPAPVATTPAATTPPPAKSPTPVATTPTTTTKPATTTTTTASTTKPATTTPSATTTPAKPTPTTTTASTAKPTISSRDDDDGPAPAASSGDSKVAVGFVLPSGGKWDDLVVGVDGSSLGKRPLRTRATPGTHTFTFKTDGLDLSCSIDVGSSGRTIILDQKKKACPSKSG